MAASEPSNRSESQTDRRADDEGEELAGQDHPSRTIAEQPNPEASTSAGGPSRLLLSRVLVTWLELTLVGFGGAALGGATLGLPQLVIYPATTLLSVGVLLYNVDRLVRARFDR